MTACTDCGRRTRSVVGVCRHCCRVDWLAVELVVSGHSLKLRDVDARAVVRRLDERMIRLNENAVDLLPGQLTSQMVAERLQMDARSVTRIRSMLPPAVKARCAVCGEVMWVREDGAIEPHDDGGYRTCYGAQQVSA